MKLTSLVGYEIRIINELQNRGSLVVAVDFSGTRTPSVAFAKGCEFDALSQKSTSGFCLAMSATPRQGYDSFDISDLAGEDCGEVPRDRFSPPEGPPSMTS